MHTQIRTDYSIEAPPMLKPAHKYCDITGLIVCDSACPFARLLCVRARRLARRKVEPL